MSALDELRAETSALEAELRRRSRILSDVDYLAKSLAGKDAACEVVRSGIDQLTITVDSL